MTRLIIAIIGAMSLMGCASAPPGPAPYLAIYRPLEPRPGEIIVSLTAALDGRLSIEGGCFVVSGEGASILVAFQDQVQPIHSGGRWGLFDTKSKARVYEGEQISVGGGSGAEPARFIAERVISGPPGPGCPRELFISNAGFGMGRRGT